VLYSTVLYCTVLHCTVLYCTVLHCIVLYCTALHCTALHCTALQCTVLYCAELRSCLLRCTPLAGRLEGATSGTSTWLLAGRDAAAPSGPVSYDVGGTLRYTVEGVGTGVEVELASVRVTVQPQPQLQAHYFIQRDVISDNPFTTEVRTKNIPCALLYCIVL